MIEAISRLVLLRESLKMLETFGKAKKEINPMRATTTRSSTRVKPRWKALRKPALSVIEVRTGADARLKSVLVGDVFVTPFAAFLVIIAERFQFVSVAIREILKIISPSVLRKFVYVSRRVIAFALASACGFMD